MIIKPYSYNGTSLQSTDYVTSIPRSSALSQLNANLSYVRRAGAEPVYAGKDFQPVTLNLEVILQHDYMSLIEDLNQLFDVHDETPRQFIIQDTEDSNRQYYVYATAKQVLAGHDGSMAVVTLGLDDSVWQTVTQNSQTLTISSTNATTDVTTIGNIDAYPYFELTVSAYPTTGYIYNRYVLWTPASTDAWPNRPVEILATTDNIGFDTAALVSGGKALSSGNDFLVFVDGVEVDRWFGGAGFNTTDTKCWINLDVPPRRQFVLKTAISNSGTPSTIDVNWSTTDAAMMADMPTPGRLVINSEEFTYTGKYSNSTSKLLWFEGITRAQRNTSAGTHAVNDAVVHVPYNINIIYSSTDATAPIIDESRKPIINLSTSNNGTFVYADFADDARLRSGIWQPIKTKVSSATLSQTDFYTEAQGGDTDPAAVMGIKVPAYQSAGTWKAETSQMSWQIFVPDGISTFTSTMERYQYGATWPKTLIDVSADGKTWKNMKTYVSTDLATSDYQIWQAPTLATTDTTVPAGMKYLRYYVNGTVGAVANNVCYFGVADHTFNFERSSYATVRSEQNNYQLQMTITNSTNGQALTINYPFRTGQTMIIDCDPNFPYAQRSGIYVNGSVSLNTVRGEWLSFDPGLNNIAVTSNQVGTASLVMKWRDRRNYL